MVRNSEQRLLRIQRHMLEYNLKVETMITKSETLVMKTWTWYHTNKLGTTWPEEGWSLKGDASAVEEKPNQLHIFPEGVSNMAMIYMCEPRVMARGRSEMARYPRIHRVVIKVAGSSTLGASISLPATLWSRWEIGVGVIRGQIMAAITEGLPLTGVA